MKAVVAAFNQEKALVGAFSVITNLRMELFEALVSRGNCATISAARRRVIAVCRAELCSQVMICDLSVVTRMLGQCPAVSNCDINVYQCAQYSFSEPHTDDMIGSQYPLVQFVQTHQCPVYGHSQISDVRCKDTGPGLQQRGH